MYRGGLQEANVRIFGPSTNENEDRQMDHVEGI